MAADNRLLTCAIEDATYHFAKLFLTLREQENRYYERERRAVIDRVASRDRVPRGYGAVWPESDLSNPPTNVSDAERTTP